MNLAVLQEYKCPCCGGAIAFDSTSQKMKCPYCDTEFAMETLASYDETLKHEPADQMDWAEQAGSDWEAGETDGLRVYSCRSCGGEIVGDETCGATSCPYCGNPVVMMGQFSGALKPDYVIPFKLDNINLFMKTMKIHCPVTHLTESDTSIDEMMPDMVQHVYAVKCHRG